MGSPFEKTTIKMSKGFTKQDDCVTQPASKLSMYGGSPYWCFSRVTSRAFPKWGACSQAMHNLTKHPVVTLLPFDQGL